MLTTLFVFWSILSPCNGILYCERCGWRTSGLQWSDYFWSRSRVFLPEWKSRKTNSFLYHYQNKFTPQHSLTWVPTCVIFTIGENYGFSFLKQYVWFNERRWTYILHKLHFKPGIKTNITAVEFNSTYILYFHILLYISVFPHSFLNLNAGHCEKQKL